MNIYNKFLVSHKLCNINISLLKSTSGLKVIEYVEIRFQSWFSRASGVFGSVSSFQVPKK